ncbi:MAG: hypothetical protein A2075_09810 [Geobacteraceae bacterium GWC2_58_44]|nr:MAG: hypothetical protein A2075_09810 [Geobacteraceae bacterium GWC2_58_44]HBG06988.1 hypothetical protein [Geobacter sp.]
MEKSKGAQKGAGKQRPGTEQVRSGTNIQKGEGESERIQAPKSGEQQKQKQEQGKTSKKTGGTGS